LVIILKYFDADPGSMMETVRIRDGKKSDPGSGINIPDKQHSKEAYFLVKKTKKLLCAVEGDSEVLLHNKLEAIFCEAEGGGQRLSFLQVQLLEVEKSSLEGHTLFQARKKNI
jgi:hypothetical protein